MSTNDFTLDGLGEQAVGLWDAAKAIWLSGGWAMFAIAVIALVMFSIGLHLHLFLGRKKFLSISERKWRHWIAHPVERRGPIGDFLNMATGPRSLPEMGALLGQLRASETAPIERDLRMMRVCVGAAPLVGLLGTVTGMLTTFDALATGAGGQKTMGMIAGGISEALITTETGLLIALPGLFFQYQLMRKHERYKAFLAHVESVCTQKLYRQLRRQGGH
jgi:biopolymer transport protein ExbB